MDNRFNERIVPAIDLIEGKAVRLFQGDFNQKTIYAEDPVDVAKAFADAGARRLHLVDLDGARSGAPKNITILERILAATDLRVDFSGGVRTKQSLDMLMHVGVPLVAIGSIASKEPETVTAWMHEYPGRIILGADCKEGLIAVHGWKETSSLSIYDFLRNYESVPFHSVLVTDVSKDGALQGSNMALYRGLREAFPTYKFIASGGVTTKDEVHELYKLGMHEIIIGKALYEGHIDLASLMSGGDNGC